MKTIKVEPTAIPKHSPLRKVCSHVVCTHCPVCNRDGHMYIIMTAEVYAQGTTVFKCDLVAEHYRAEWQPKW